jgi:hypothetical protein
VGNIVKLEVKENVCISLVLDGADSVMTKGEKEFQP